MLDLSGRTGGQFTFEVVGESYYQDALDDLCGGKCEEGHQKRIIVILSPEDDNPYDSNAVAVLSRDGEKLAHLSRADAVLFRKEMARIGRTGESLKCAGLIVGGWIRPSGDEGSYGLRLRLSFPLREPAGVGASRQTAKGGCLGSLVMMCLLVAAILLIPNNESGRVHDAAFAVCAAVSGEDAWRCE